MTAVPPSATLLHGMCRGGVQFNGPTTSLGPSIGQHGKVSYVFKKPGGRTARPQISCNTTQDMMCRIRQQLSQTMGGFPAAWPSSFHVVFALFVKKLSFLVRLSQRMSKVDRTVIGSSRRTAIPTLPVQTVKYWPPGSATTKTNLPRSLCLETLIGAISLHRKLGNKSQRHLMAKTLSMTLIPSGVQMAPPPWIRWSFPLITSIED